MAEREGLEPETGGPTTMVADVAASVDRAGLAEARGFDLHARVRVSRGQRG